MRSQEQSTTEQQLKCVLLRKESILPTRGSKDAAGLDLSFCPKNDEAPVYLHPGERLMLPTGIAMGIPKGYYGRIAPRSGLALKYGIDVLAGIIDSDWLGEIQVILYNTGKEILPLYKGNRIAQIIIERCDPFTCVSVDSLDETERGDKGFGSTGI
jgi:dUTP pyrophosphatase